MRKNRVIPRRYANTGYNLRIHVKDDPRLYTTRDKDPGAWSGNALSPGGDSVDVEGYPMSPDDPRIPDNLYHVTTNLPEVLRSGYLSTSNSGGLGGAKNYAVSLTTNPHKAKAIADDLKFVINTLNKYKTILRPIPLPTDYARKLVASGIGRGEYKKLIDNWYRENGVDQQRMRAADQLTEELKQQSINEGWGPYRPIHNTHRLSAGQHLAHYLARREEQANITDPIIHGIDEMKSDPANVAVLRVPKHALKTGALVTDYDMWRGNGLDEIRHHGDLPLAGATTYSPDKMNRKHLPRRYAKVDGDVPAHHLIAGFPIEHALRHLANDPKNSSDLRDIAHLALTGKDKDKNDVNPGEALWALNDAIQEHHDEDGNPHPLRSPAAGGHGYNWMAAADKIHLDGHVHTALAEEGDRMRKEHNEPPRNPERWEYRPEGQALRMNRIFAGSLNSSTDRAREALKRIRTRVKSLSKIDDDKLVNESLLRHAQRANLVWRKEHGLSPEEDVVESIGPANPLSGKTGPVTRYSAKGDPGYSWLTPGGKFHPVIGMDTHERLIRKLGFKSIDDAYAGGWVRVSGMGGILYTRNPHQPPSGVQRRALIDHAMENRYEAVVHEREDGSTSRVLWDSQDRLKRKGQPVRKSLAVRGDFIDSLRRVRSSNIQALNKTADQVARKLGLHPTKILPALHDTRYGSSPGVAQAIYGMATPEQIHTAAAWIGSVGNLPGVMIHHVRPNGPDTLYKFRQVGSGLDIRDKLNKAGLTDRVIAIPEGEPAKVGFDILIPDKGNRQKAAVYNYAKRFGLAVQASPGHIKTIGSQTQADARNQYRGQIAKGERMARKGEALKYAVPTGWYKGRKGLPHAMLAKWLKNTPGGQMLPVPNTRFAVGWHVPDEPNAAVNPKASDILVYGNDRKPVMRVKPDGSYIIESGHSKARSGPGTTPDEMKLLINNFVGTNAAAIKRGVVHVSGKPLEIGQTLWPQDRSIINWWNQVKLPVKNDYNAAAAFADHLEEAGDWRHHLVRKLADFNHHDSNVDRPAKPDGTPHAVYDDMYDKTPYYRMINEGALVHRALQAHQDWLRSRSFPKTGRIWYGYTTSETGKKPAILIRTNLTQKGEPKSTKYGYTVFTPEEYGAMRVDAEKSGVKLPTPPESHRPKPTQMRRLPSRVIRMAARKLLTMDELEHIWESLKATGEEHRYITGPIFGNETPEQALDRLTAPAKDVNGSIIHHGYEPDYYVVHTHDTPKENWKPLAAFRPRVADDLPGDPTINPNERKHIPAGMKGIPAKNHITSPTGNSIVTGTIFALALPRKKV